MPVNERWSLVEYDAPKELLGDICSVTGFTHQQVHELLIKSGEKAGRALGFSSNPLAISISGIRATDFAGILRVAPRIEIEIAPKFLGLDSANPGWREDFFFLATLSRHGRLLDSERLKTRSGERGDLHTLVARSMVDMYWSNHRRPLRTYNVHSYNEFAFDGDVEPEDVLLPSSEGFFQTAMAYDRKNSYNATILAAARSILPNLHDPSSIAQLERMISALSPQKIKNRRVSSFTFPSRSKHWQPLYELSVDVLNGFGLTFDNGNASAPGYVLDTWRVWEDLLGIALRLGFGAERIKTQVSSKLGTRQKIFRGHKEKPYRAQVKPDIVVYSSTNSEISFLVDAKYKGNVLNGRTRISEADLYESLAFSKATDCETVILAYPSLSSSNLGLGSVEPFEIIVVDNTKIIGVEIETKGISTVSGLNIFSERCVEQIEKIALG